MTRFTRITRAAALAAALVTSGGCATKGDLRALRVEMRALADRQDSILVALERQALVTQDTLRRQNNQLIDIRGDVSRQLQQILNELATLRALAGENQRSIAGLRAEVNRSGRAPAGPAAGGETIVGPDDLAGEVAATGRAELTYNAAVQQHQRGSLGTAQLAFETFLRDFSGHELAPQALFYLGDLHEQQDRLQDAIEAFDRIPELHPTAPRVPDALYRIALLHLELENRQEGIRYLERVVNTYPDSDAAGLARARLGELR